MEDFDERVRTMLPEQYQDGYEQVRPVSMGSAPIRFQNDGKVAWDQMWGSFCDLAMAGGPPHKGALLEPGSAPNVLALPEMYEAVTREIRRGVELVTGLAAESSAYPGWILVDCTSTAQAGWLARAIVMENVSVAVQGMELYLPAGPYYRVEKEIKNVVTVMAKTCHYWFGHTSLEQRRAIARLLQQLQTTTPLICPVFPREDFVPVMDESLYNRLARRIHAATRLRCSPRDHGDWLGIQLHGVRPAIWLMRALIVSNVFARREENVVFAAVNPVTDPQGEALARRVIQAYQLGAVRQVFT